VRRFRGEGVVRVGGGGCRHYLGLKIRKASKLMLGILNSFYLFGVELF